jgi:tetratricopeptide (TPR) repeat protein
MDYPGDPALSQEIRARVLTTFRQTVELAEEGRLQEASLGCDFILKMDPRFDPARRLQERLSTAAGALRAADLVPGAAPVAAVVPPPPPVAAASAPVDDLRTVQFSPQDLALTLADEGVDLAALFETPAGPPPLEQKPGSGRDGSDALAAPPPGPPVAPGGDSKHRIQELLAEGQEAFDQGQYQNAIDAWSRIFLIDLDHAEANERIEAARKLKAEQERVADEQLHEGIRAFEEGRAEEARRVFEQVLAQNPNHLAARDYLAQLPPPSGGPVLAEGSPTSFQEPPDLPLPASFAVEAEPDATPPSPSAAAKTSPRGAMVAGRGQAKVAREDRRLVWIGAGALVLLLAGAWFLATNWKRLFPNAAETPPVAAATTSAIDEATRLHEAGDVAGAMARLRRIPPQSPERARARELLAEWQEEAPETPTAAPPTADVEAQREALEAERAALLERARRAHEEREYWRAVKSFRAAEQIAPLEGPVADLYADTKRQLLPIATHIDLFQQREWDRALPTLWRQHVDDAENRDIRRLLVDTLFNLGVEALRSGDKAAAAENFRDLVGIDPEDALAERLLLFAERYPGTSQDLVFQILASRLEFRT